MSNRTGKIGKVVALAASEERRHGEASGRSQKNLDDQEQRLGELNAFRQSYSRQNSAATSVSAAHWKDYQNFLQRLDRAVLSQQQIAKDSEKSLELHRHRWMAKRQRLDSLQRVLEKCHKLDAVQEATLEQKNLDDLNRGAPSTVFAEED